MTSIAGRGRRVLVAGIGNVLRGDDGFGPAVVDALAASGRLGRNVRTIEIGIGGIGLVQELMQSYDALIIVDAVDREKAPGSLFVLEVEVPEIENLPVRDRYEISVDMHEATADRMLVVARAAGVLPATVRIVGCQPAETDDFSMQLSPEVDCVVPRAVETILAIIDNELSIGGGSDDKA